MPRDLPGAVLPDTPIRAEIRHRNSLVLRLGFFYRQLIFLPTPNALYHVRAAAFV
jgi:hypothetical protein